MCQRLEEMCFSWSSICFWRLQGPGLPAQGWCLGRQGSSCHLEAALVIKPWPWGSCEDERSQVGIGFPLLLSGEGVHEQVPAPKATVEGGEHPSPRLRGLGCLPKGKLGWLLGRREHSPCLVPGLPSESVRRVRACESLLAAPGPARSVGKQGSATAPARGPGRQPSARGLASYLYSLSWDRSWKRHPDQQ